MPGLVPGLLTRHRRATWHRQVASLGPQAAVAGRGGCAGARPQLPVAVAVRWHGFCGGLPLPERAPAYPPPLNLRPFFLRRKPAGLLPPATIQATARPSSLSSQRSCRPPPEPARQRGGSSLRAAGGRAAPDCGGAGSSAGDGLGARRQLPDGRHAGGALQRHVGRDAAGANTAQHTARHTACRVVLVTRCWRWSVHNCSSDPVCGIGRIPQPLCLVSY